MTTMTAKSLYISGNGEVSCADHGGHYLKSAHENRPTATTHVTPRESWDRMTTDYIVMWVDAFGTSPRCARCV